MDKKGDWLTLDNTTNNNILKYIPYFDKNVTNIIKGVALIMMFIHHLFTFPEWWIDGISYPIIERIAPYICQPLRLCVPIFAFVTGYFYYFNKKKTYKYSLRKISDILITYWSVYLIFALVAAIFLKYRYSFWDVIKECFALSRPTMTHCWYVYFYIALMLVLPLIVKLMAKDIHIDLLLTFAIFPLAFRVIDVLIRNDIADEVIGGVRSWLPIVLTGFIFARYDLFSKLEKLNLKIIKWKWLNVAIWLVVLLIVPFGRYFEPGLTLSFKYAPTFYINLDVIYTPLFIYCLVNLFKAMKHGNIVGKPFALIGKYSLLMWFLHCGFANNCKTIFQPVLYAPKDPLLVTIWGLVMCLAVAFVLDLGIKKVQEWKNRVLRL